MIKIQKLNFIGLVLTVAIFEGFALLFMALFGYSDNNSLLDRILIGFNGGFATGIAALSLYNNIKWLKIKFYDKGKLFTIDKISVIKFSIINGIFLMLLFFIEFFTNRLRINFIYIAILGLIVTFFTIFLLLLTYNLVVKEINIFWINKKQIKIKHISLSTALIVGLFEMFILPFLVFLMGNAVTLLDYFISGFISGMIGSIIAIITYNFIFYKIPIKLET